MKTVVCGVYAIVHRPTGRMYVGSSSDVRRRLRQHVARFNAGRSDNPRLQNAWGKYGMGAFTFILLARCTSGVLLAKEQRFLDTLECFYNINRQAEQPPRHHYSPALLARLAAAGRRSARRPENVVFARALGSRQGALNVVSGHMQRLAELNRGNQYSAGRSPSPEHLKKMIEGSRRAWTPERCAKISAAKRRTA